MSQDSANPSDSESNSDSDSATQGPGSDRRTGARTQGPRHRDPDTGARTQGLSGQLEIPHCIENAHWRCTRAHMPFCVVFVIYHTGIHVPFGRPNGPGGVPIIRRVPLITAGARGMRPYAAVQPAFGAFLRIGLKLTRS